MTRLGSVSTVPTGWVYFLDVGIAIPEFNGRILRCRPDGTDCQELITNIKTMPDGIAIDTTHGHIYWTNMGVPSLDNGSIQRCDLSGRNIVTILPEGHTHTPKQLIIAPKSQKLYWSDREGTRIMRANKDGSDVEILFQASNSTKQSVEDWCVGIAVDEDSGSIYWTQKGPSKGNKGRIFRMNIEIGPGESVDQRTDIECLVEGLPEPIDLELDHEAKMLYWTDRGDPPRGNTVNRISLTKFTPRVTQPTIIATRLHEGIGISMDTKRGRLFFGDLGGSLYSSNLDGTNKSTVIHDIGGAITGVVFLDE